MLEAAISQVQGGQSLSREQMTEIVDWIMKGNVPDENIARLLTALYEKGESVGELAGAASAMRMHMNPIRTTRSNPVDTCGTGGGGAGTFNISTAAALVAAAAGAVVAKHGNRKSTSKTGSADVLQRLGVNIECELAVVERSLDELGICFCFAPLFHPSVRHVMNVRRKLPHPTIFNLLGPLCNPAAAPFQTLGAGRGETRKLIAEALALLGTGRSMVLHSRDGLGEISNSAPTDVCEVNGNEVTEIVLQPSDFGIDEPTTGSILASGPDESAEIIHGILSGKPGVHREIAVVNAAAAVYVSGVCSSLVDAARRCEQAIDSGEALQKLEGLRQVTNRNS